MKRSITPRGFKLIEFTDLYGVECSLQESSLHTPMCVWLGPDNNRMHLDQATAQQIVDELTVFIKTGYLAEQ